MTDDAARQPTSPGGQELVSITALSTGGDGVGRLADGRVVFVPATAPGDRVALQLTQQKKRFARALVERLVEPGASRVEPLCPIVEQCGGCQWQHVGYGEQLRQKQALIEHRLARLGGVIAPIIPSPRPFGYRQRARLRFEADDRSVRLGFREGRSHALVPLERCAVVDERINAVLPLLRGWLASLRGGGEIELLSNGEAVGVAVRCDRDTVEVRSLGALPTGIAGLRLERPGATLELGVDKLRFGELDVPLGGFWQSNVEANERLLQVVRDFAAELAPEGGRLLELYCGAGNFTHELVERASRLVAVESNGAAIEMLRARVGQLPAFRERDVELVAAPVLAYLETCQEPFELALLDPRAAAPARRCRTSCACAPNR